MNRANRQPGLRNCVEHVRQGPVVNSDTRTDSVTNARTGEGATCVPIAGVKLQGVAVSGGKRPHEAGMHTNVGKATPVRQDSCDLLKHDEPVIYVRVQQRRSNGWDAVVREWELLGIRQHNRQMPNRMAQLPRREVNTERIPSQFSQEVTVNACTAADVDAATSPSTEDLSQCFRHPLGVSGGSPNDVLRVPV